MKNYIVGIGEALWDMLPAGKQLGGAPANFAYHVKRLGLPAKVVSAVGRDALGNEIVQLLREKDIPFLVPQIGYPTGSVQVSLDEAGIPSYEIMTDVAWDNIPYSAELEELAHHTQVVCFGSLAQRSKVSYDTINRFLDEMPEGEGVWKVFDINLRQQFYTKEILHRSLCKCNVLKINDEELEQVRQLFGLSGDSLEDRCRQLLDEYQLKMVILTCGDKGSYVVTSEDVFYQDTPRVKVVDTVGAGDAFTAAFMAGILKGYAIADAHRLAVDVSAWVCTQSGAMPE